jgi:hypothetical protein
VSEALIDPRRGRAMFERLRLWERLVGEVAPAAVAATPCRERLGMALAIAAPTGCSAEP